MDNSLSIEKFLIMKSFYYEGDKNMYLIFEYYHNTNSFKLYCKNSNIKYFNVSLFFIIKNLKLDKRNKELLYEFIKEYPEYII